ncbi:hypothetical protein ACP70R_016715 [Stipagrostis hirtigluma subsp. patula]
MEMLSSVEKSTNDDRWTKTAGYDRSTAKGSVLNHNNGSTSRIVAVQNHGCAAASSSSDSTTLEGIRGKRPDYYMKLCCCSYGTSPTEAFERAAAGGTIN